MLTSLICLPLITAAILLAVPRGYRLVFRGLTLLATCTMLCLAAALCLRFDGAPAVDGFKFQSMVPWVSSLGIGYHVGLDGISLALVVLAAVVAFAAACVSWEIRSHDKEYYILLLVMTGGIVGAFASLDIFFLYFFHELALVPTFIMIGIWGRGERKNYATFQITMYLTAGALIALAGLIAIYVQVPPEARTFDLVALTQYFRTYPMAASAQHWIFPVLMLGFGILVSLWPFHTWAPLAYASAPTATAMLHAGVLKKFGLYALLRIAVPMMPDAAERWLPVIAVLALGNILFCGLVAMRQRDLNLLIGNSSVAHMGFVFLGIASLNPIGVTGAVVVMVGHGLLAALSFGLSGYLYQHTDTLEISRFGGLMRRMPFVGAALMMALLAGCGVPGFANFAGEILVLFGGWKQFPWIVAAAAWGGLVIGAVYMLRAARHLLHGPLPDSWAHLPDANLWRRVPFVVLLAGLLALGCFPSVLTDRIRNGAASLLEGARPKASQSAELLDPRQAAIVEARGMP